MADVLLKDRFLVIRDKLVSGELKEELGSCHLELVTVMGTTMIVPVDDEAEGVKFLKALLYSA